MASNWTSGFTRWQLGSLWEAHGQYRSYPLLSRMVGYQTLPGQEMLLTNLVNWYNASVWLPVMITVQTTDPDRGYVVAVDTLTLVTAPHFPYGYNVEPP